MDFGAGWDGISRYIGELLSDPVMAGVATLTFALPVVSMGLGVARRRLALVPLLLSLGLLAVWFLAYATDWWSNQGQGVWVPAFMVVLFGWGFAFAAARAGHR